MSKLRPAVRCSGKSSQTGKPCKCWAMHGATTCHAHGGRAPQVRKAAAAKVARRTALAAVAALGLTLTREIPPEEGLLEEVRRTAGLIHYIEQVLKDLEPAALVWGRTQEEHITATEFRGTNTRDAAGLNTWLEWYLQERAHFVKVCATAIKCGIKERRLHLEEERLRLMIGVVRTIVVGLGHSPTDPKVGEIVTTAFRALSVDP